MQIDCVFYVITKKSEPLWSSQLEFFGKQGVKGLMLTHNTRMTLLRLDHSPFGDYTVPFNLWYAYL